MLSDCCMFLSDVTKRTQIGVDKFWEKRTGARFVAEEWLHSRLNVCNRKIDDGANVI